ncbi:MAG: tryptophan--tRNA ligase [Anaerolineae bacterium]|nr:tryptophan--tRNA ligase [Anaerolineae bacterium]
MAVGKRMFTGLQPSGQSLHIGNYLSAIKGVLALQDTHECILCVVDYHAITVPYDPNVLRRFTLNIATEYLAAGVDPERVTMMVQSDVPEHTELAWLMGCLMPVPKFEQLPTYKDKRARYGTASFGLLAYPILMAADILIYKAHTVPVGRDQLPHIEFAREVARKFNHTFGETFPEPEARINAGAYIPSLDGKGAMSKSAKNGSIDLSDTANTVQDKLARAVTDPARVRRTDPGEPHNCPVYAIHVCYTPQGMLAQLAQGCREAAIGCLECKRILAQEIISDLAPLQARRRELLARPQRVREILAQGAATARPRARETLSEVRQRMGLD